MTGMDRETRIAWLVDHAKRLPPQESASDADVRMTGGNPGCGDQMTVHLQADPAEDRIAVVRFEGVGCTLSRAAASVLAERTNLTRPTFAEIERSTDEAMLDLVGRDVAGARPRCTALALDTLKAAVKAVQLDRKLKQAGHSAAQIAELRRAATTPAVE